MTSTKNILGGKELKNLNWILKMIDYEEHPEVGQYKLERMRALERLYKKLKIEFDFNEIKKLSRSEIAIKIRAAQKELGFFKRNRIRRNFNWT